MFRSPDYKAAKERKRNGWESDTQKAKTEAWLRSRGLTPPQTADECWELVLNTLTEALFASKDVKEPYS